MSFKVLIADDDEGMRLILKKAISRFTGYEVAGEAADGASALQLAEDLKPDVIFMDVEMPVMNGIDCAGKIMDINPKTFIIFATAHEEYMPDAFRLYAFDYMVKPFRVERIYQTLARISELADSPSEAGVFVGAAGVSVRKHPDKLVIRNKEGLSFVNTEDIILVQREDRSSVIYTADGRYVTSDGLTELEEKLDASMFLRSHKSYIISLSSISRIYPYGRWTYIVKLKGTDKDALMTHEKYEELEKMFK